VLLGLPEFELLSAESVEETCALLSRYEGEAAVLAGGTDLLTKMKLRRMVPRRLINIKGIANLDQIRHDEREGLRIGALTTIQAIETSQVISKKFPALKQAAGVLGTTQIRNVGTLGGNLVNASPSAEFAPPLLTLGASVRCAGRGGERLVPLAEFFVAPGKTALRQDELLTEVHVPNAPAGAQGIYLKHSLRKMDVAIASAAVLIVLEGDVCKDVRIALGAVGPIPFRANKAEQTLQGKRLGGGSGETELLEEVARVAADESFPIDDFRGYAGYRRKLVAMLVGKGLERIIARIRA
jgi:aerobic carbon-monoxide dehydrogenase medium subunit